MNEVSYSSSLSNDFNPWLLIGSQVAISNCPNLIMQTDQEKSKDINDLLPRAIDIGDIQISQGLFRLMLKRRTNLEKKAEQIRH